jgi:thiol-disulfide isomerase/thioredoxin
MRWWVCLWLGAAACGVEGTSADDDGGGADTQDGAGGDDTVRDDDGPAEDVDLDAPCGAQGPFGADVGDCFPAVRATAPDGTVRDVLPAGTPAIVDLSAGWCSKCQVTAPLLDDVAEAEPALAVVTIVYEGASFAMATPADAAAWVDALDVEHVVLADTDGSVESALPVRQRPALWAINAGGRITWARGGTPSAAQLSEAADAALGR